MAISTIWRLATLSVPTFTSGIDVDVEPLEQIDRLAVHLAVIDEAEAVLRLAPDPDVLGHRHRRHQVQLLMDHGDAVFERVERAVEADILAAAA